jgi:hypothetical protein
LNDRKNQFAILIVEHELGAKQVRTAHVAASQVGAVARSTRHAIQVLSTLDLRRIARRSLLRRECRLTTAAAATLTLALPLTLSRRAWRHLWLTLRSQARGDTYQQEQRSGSETASRTHQDHLDDSRR